MIRYLKSGFWVLGLFPFLDDIFHCNGNCGSGRRSEQLKRKSRKLKLKLKNMKNIRVELGLTSIPRVMIG